MLFSYLVPSQLILKCANTLDILIHQIVYMEYFADTLLILQNFEKPIWMQKTWMKFNQLFWQKLFFQSFGELAKCHQNMLYEQSDVSEYLECGHILTSICEGALGQETKTKLFWTWIEFVSLHAICRADPPCLSMASNCHLWAILVWCHQLFI